MTTANHDLTITRRIAASPSVLYRCWTDPALIVQWFTPPPFVTVSAEMDVRPGGGSAIVMRSPDGTDYPNRGQYLEVVHSATGFETGWGIATDQLAALAATL